MALNAEISSAFDHLELELLHEKNEPAGSFDFCNLIDFVIDNDANAMLNISHIEGDFNAEKDSNSKKNLSSDLTKFDLAKLSNDGAVNSYSRSQASSNTSNNLPWVNSKLYDHAFVDEAPFHEKSTIRGTSETSTFCKESLFLGQNKDFMTGSRNKNYESSHYFNKRGSNELKGASYFCSKQNIGNKLKTLYLQSNMEKTSIKRDSELLNLDFGTYLGSLSRDLSNLQNTNTIHEGPRHMEKLAAMEMDSSNFNSLLYVNLCIESRSFHFGPLQLEVYPHLTLQALKMKICSDLNIKSRSQKWIVGNQLVDDDNLELNMSNIVPGSFIYLYLEDRDLDRDKFLEFFNGSNTNTVSKEPFTFNEQNSLMLTSVEHSQSPNKTWTNLDQTDNSYSPSVKSKYYSSKQGSNVGFTSLKKTERKNSDLADKLKLLKLQQLQTTVVKKDEDFTEDNSSSSSFDSAEEALSDIDSCESDYLKTCQSFSDISDSKGKITNAEEVQNDDEILRSAGALGSSASVNTSNCDNKITDNIRDEARRNYNELLQLDSMSLIPNAYSFDCPVCFSHVLDGQGVVLRDCLHTFCKECLACAVIYACTSFVRCPFRDDIYSCDSCLQQREIRALVSTEAYEHYLQRSLVVAESVAEKSFHCKNTNCPGWCLYEDNLNIFHCPVCSHFNCLTCQAIHEGINCRQYQDHLKQSAVVDEDAVRTLEFLDQMVGEGKAMKCPTCHVILMKKWGCDWLKCSVCQTEVCWITKGPRWGPGGQGDISSGCRCGVNGKKCHPSCTYCH